VTLTVNGPESGPYRWTLTVTERRSPTTFGDELRVALADCDRGPVQLWIEAVDPDTEQQATELGFVAFRDLWQLRCPLPLPPTQQKPLITRAFTAEDADAFLAVNREAFAWHPEQGALSADDLEQRSHEPWFNPEGFRLLHDGPDLIGFCWTKIHQHPPLGEIYAIAVHPSHHGQGLGLPLTRAGLDWLADQGLTTGMLYVESDNDAANAVYARLGFVHHQTNRAYRYAPND